jgi:hypothetical protein
MTNTAVASSALKLSDQEISDAYIYLLGRLLITRQQQVDFDTEGFVWNQLLHREPGQVDWPNPNLDVAYSEAWIAIDETSFLLVTVPAITGRYYVVEFLDGWGETVANVNERVYPDHPNGLFAVCLAGSQADIPAGAKRVDVPVKTMRVLLRVELGANWDEAIALQHQFKFEIRAIRSCRTSLARSCSTWRRCPAWRRSIPPVRRFRKRTPAPTWSSFRPMSARLPQPSRTRASGSGSTRS